MLKNLLTTLALLIMPLSLAAQGNFISVSMIEDSKEMNTGGMLWCASFQTSTTSTLLVT